MRCFEQLKEEEGCEESENMSTSKHTNTSQLMT